MNNFAKAVSEKMRKQRNNKRLTIEEAKLRVVRANPELAIERIGELVEEIMDEQKEKSQLQARFNTLVHLFIDQVEGKELDPEAIKNVGDSFIIDALAKKTICPECDGTAWVSIEEAWCDDCTYYRVIGGQNE